jgi:hypothetical protein
VTKKVVGVLCVFRAPFTNNITGLTVTFPKGIVKGLASQHEGSVLPEICELSTCPTKTAQDSKGYIIFKLLQKKIQQD